MAGFRRNKEAISRRYPRRTRWSAPPAAAVAPPVTGTAQATLTPTATISGVPEKLATAAATLGTTAAAAGIPEHLATAAATLDVTATAAGTGTAVGAGTAAATLSITATIAGVPTKPATAAATLDVTATVAGVPTKVAAAAATLTPTATISGVRATTGTAAATLGVTATASGQVPAAPGALYGSQLGTPTAQPGNFQLGTLPAVGPAVVQGAAAATLAVSGTIAGRRDVTAQAAATLAIAGTALGGAVTWGIPQGLTATAMSDTQIDLAWTGIVAASGYDIERDGAVIVTDHPATTYSDTGLTPSTLYSYRVAAVG